MPRRIVLLTGVLAAAALVGPSLVSARVVDSPGDGNPTVIRQLNRTWHCTGPQNGTTVYVSILNDSNTDAVMLDAGCTGTLALHIATNGGDGVKVHDGAASLVVTGDVTCSGHAGAKHQDGIQAMGGHDVQFGDGRTAGSFMVSCPSGNNGGLFINRGDGDRSVPTGIVCDHCNLYEGNVAVHIGNSVGSGARNSVLHLGTGGASPRGLCMRVNSDAVTPVETGNTCV